MKLRNFQHTDVGLDGVRGNGMKVPIKPSIDVRKPDKENKNVPYTIVVNEALTGTVVNGVFIIFDDEKEYNKFLSDFKKKA